MKRRRRKKLSKTIYRIEQLHFFHFFSLVALRNALVALRQILLLISFKEIQDAEMMSARERQ